MPDRDKSGPRAATEGVVEGLKGKAKEVAGAVAGDRDREREGVAQQDKARADREVVLREAEADKARAESKAREAEQAAHQKR